MAFQLLFNIIIADIWMFLQNSFTFTNFFIGYIIGIIILFILRRILVFEFYMNRTWAIIKLIVLFIIELIKANIDVIKIVLNPRLNNQPGIVAVKTSLKSDVEITLLAALISLTTGTTSLDFSAVGNTIYVHSLDVTVED